ncbi:hypothetical protein [Halobaculum sp. MBLA0143]|uniref:hypothetical protein n=1 Tax=Halobaculum sp. MBLA0143 TaxID=3079933 RepID=UPI0035240C19
MAVVALGASLYTAGRYQETDGPPIETDCQYDEPAAQLRFEVERGSVTEREFDGLWVYVDDELASLSGPQGRTDTGAWVIDGNVSDAADYPVERGSTVTVHGVGPDSDVYVTVAWENTEANSLTAAADPAAADCSRVSV